MSDSTPLKRCSKCKNEYPATPEFFTRNKSCSDGLHTICKTCKQQQNKAYLDTNKDRVNASRRQRYRDDENKRQQSKSRGQKWRAENREKSLESKKQYYWDNREDSLQKSREWRETNQEYARERNRLYNKRNRKKIRARQQQWEDQNRDKINSKRRQQYSVDPISRKAAKLAREARKRELPSDFTVEDYNRMMAYWGGCAITGETENLEIDHWIALNSPDCPGTIPTNMIPLTVSLNASKQDTDPVEWLVWKFGEAEAFKILQKIQDYFDWIETQQ